MKRFLYDRMVTEYSKETKEELVQRIMALEEIECEDRCFANQCFSNVTVLHINELFAALKEMKVNPSYENIAKVIKHVEWAENSWNCILRGLSEMNDNSSVIGIWMILKEELRTEEKAFETENSWF